MTPMTDQERTEIQEAIERVDNAENAIRKAMQPHMDAIDQLDALRENILQAHGITGVVGHCEGCQKILFEGEKGFRFEDGPICCEACAPTWEDTAREMKRATANGGQDEAEANATFLKQMNAHIEAGGRADDKHVYEL